MEWMELNNFRKTTNLFLRSRCLSVFRFLFIGVVIKRFVSYDKSIMPFCLKYHSHEQIRFHPPTDSLRFCSGLILEGAAVYIAEYHNVVISIHTIYVVEDDDDDNNLFLSCSVSTMEPSSSRSFIRLFLVA